MEQGRLAEEEMKRGQDQHHRWMKPPENQLQPRKCPRCESPNTKFCYYNNYSLSQPRYFCEACRRYWTQGGTLRNVPVGGGCRKGKRSKASSSGGESSRSQPSQPPPLPPPPHELQVPQNLATKELGGNLGIPPMSSYYSSGGFLSSLAAMQSLSQTQVPFNQQLNVTNIRYWTQGGTLRNVAVGGGGGGCRKGNRSKCKSNKNVGLPNDGESSVACRLMDAGISISDIEEAANTYSKEEEIEEEDSKEALDVGEEEEEEEELDINLSRLSIDGDLEEERTGKTTTKKSWRRWRWERNKLTKRRTKKQQIKSDVSANSSNLEREIDRVRGEIKALKRKLKALQQRHGRYRMSDREGAIPVTEQEGIGQG